MAAVNAVARAERAALADLLDEVGPDAPTLCAGWSARDLAAHLVLRENRPEALGLVLPPLRGRMDRVQGSIARTAYPALVDRVRQGPPFWNPMGFGPVDAMANTVEFFVHHEDVRRGAPGWAPRALDGATLDALWRVVPTTLRAIASRCPVGIEVEPTDGPEAGSRRLLRSGSPGVVLRGPVGEILLAVYGRITEGLEVDGPDDAVAAFAAFPR